jgi:hypothetical protein
VEVDGVGFRLSAVRGGECDEVLDLGRPLATPSLCGGDGRAASAPWRFSSDLWASRRRLFSGFSVSEGSLYRLSVSESCVAGACELCSDASGACLFSLVLVLPEDFFWGLSLLLEPCLDSDGAFPTPLVLLFKRLATGIGSVLVDGAEGDLLLTEGAFPEGFGDLRAEEALLGRAESLPTEGALLEDVADLAES